MLNSREIRRAMYGAATLALVNVLSPHVANAQFSPKLNPIRPDLTELNSAIDKSNKLNSAIDSWTKDNERKITGYFDGHTWQSIDPKFSRPPDPNVNAESIGRRKRLQITISNPDQVGREVLAFVDRQAEDVNDNTRIGEIGVKSGDFSVHLYRTGISGSYWVLDVVDVKDGKEEWQHYSNDPREIGRQIKIGEKVKFTEELDGTIFDKFSKQAAEVLQAAINGASQKLQR